MLIAIARSVGSIFTGLLAAFVLVVGVEGIGAVMHPFPPGADPSDMEVCKEHVARYPTPALLVGFAGWGITVLISCWLAAWMARRLGSARPAAHGIVVGVILFLLAGVNMLMLPYATWFWVANLFLFPACIYLGTMLGRGRPASGQAATR